MKKISFIIICMIICSFVLSGAKSDRYIIKKDSLKDIVPAYDKYNLSRSGGMGLHRSMHPYVKVLSNGNVFAIWEEGEHESATNLVYRIFNQETKQWEPGLNSLPKTAATRVYAAGFPTVSENSKGDVLVCYQDGVSKFTRDAWIATLKDGKWTKERVLYTPTNSAWPRLSVDPATDDLYVTWDHEHANQAILFDGDIIYVKKQYGSDKWEGPWNISRTPASISIHQASTFVNDKLYVIWQDGSENNWTLMGNIITKAGNIGTNQPIAKYAYWPELDHDSEGNVIGVFTYKGSATMNYAMVEKGQTIWKNMGAVTSVGRGDFMGIAIGKNNVAYAVCNVGIGEGKYGMAYSRFTKGNVSPRVYLHEAMYPKRYKIDVDFNGGVCAIWSDFTGDAPGTDAYPSDVWFKYQPQTGGPTVDVSVASDTIITGDSVTFTGNVVTGGDMQTHTWYMRDQKVWQTGKTLTHTFNAPGTYTVNYFVADKNNLMGHKAKTIEVVDAPYEPVNASAQKGLVVKGFSFRRYYNKLTWTNDSRNTGKFENLTHFNLFRKKNTDTEWTLVQKVDFTEAAVNFVDDKIKFTSAADAQSYQYAVSVVAEVAGSEKESKIVIF